MNYWLLTTEYPPFYGGGISTYCYYTAQMLQRKGHQVTVFIFDLSISENEVSVLEGIRIVRFTIRKTIDNQSLGFTTFVSYGYANIVKQYLQDEGVPDILEAQEYQGIAYYIQQFKLFAYEGFKNLTILITCHAPSFICLEYNQVPIYQFPNFWTGQMEQSVIKSADILISPSEYFIKEAKKRMDWNNTNAIVVPNPIQLTESKHILPCKKNMIVCFGKLSPLKGTFELLKYFKELWDRGFANPLIMVGATDQFFHPESKTMNELVTANYSQYIKAGLLVLKGELHPEQAKEYIKEARVIIVPSIFDNFPYTVMEAMSVGKIVLASIQGGQREMIIDEENGFLFDHSSPQDFGQKLNYILNLPDTKINEIGEKAVQTIASRYSPDVIYKNKISIIEDHLKKNTEPSCFPFIRETISLKSDHLKTANNLILSIVVPYYNMGPFIEDCIQSIANSSYETKEIIIIDDGSTDSYSIRKLIEIEKRYPVKVYRKENEGLPKTRNFGATIAKGTYLAFLDADDTVEPSYYEKAIRVLNIYGNIYFVGCWTNYTGLTKGVWPTFNPEPPYLLLHNMVNSSALIYKREAFKISGLNNPELIYGMEDWDSVLSMVKHGYRGIVLPEILFNYRVRKGSMARSFTRVKQLYLHRIISQQHRDFYNQYGNEIFNLLNANGSSLNFDNPTFDPPSFSSNPIFRKLNGRFKERVKNRIKQNKYLRKIAYDIYSRLKK